MQSHRCDDHNCIPSYVRPKHNQETWFEGAVWHRHKNPLYPARHDRHSTVGLCGTEFCIRHLGFKRLVCGGSTVCLLRGRIYDMEDSLHMRYFLSQRKIAQVRKATPIRQSHIGLYFDSDRNPSASLYRGSTFVVYSYRSGYRKSIRREEASSNPKSLMIGQSV